MKKILFILILFIHFLMTGCTPSQENDPTKLYIIATIFAPYDFAREIVGDKAEVTMLLPPSTESHTYEPTPQDIKQIQQCDVFIYVGGESDAWISKVLESIGDTALRTVTLMDCVELMEKDMMEDDGHDHDHTNEDVYDHDEHIKENDHHNNYNAVYDEHVWTSPKNAKRIVQKISDAICEADEDNADFYQQNAITYLDKLDELDAAFQTVVTNAARKTIVFGDRFPFQYLAEAYGLEYYAAFPGCSPATEPSIKQITSLINVIDENNIPVVFYLELSNEKMADTIHDETGAKKSLLHSCHNISKDDFNAGVSYLDLMLRNVDALEEALNG